MTDMGARDMEKVVYGECVSLHETAQVRISRLADVGCDLEMDDGAALGGDDVALWIGAVGPFAATAHSRSARCLSVRFKQPLDRKIVAHFREG